MDKARKRTHRCNSLSSSFNPFGMTGSDISSKVEALRGFGGAVGGALQQAASTAGQALRDKLQQADQKPAESKRSTLEGLLEQEMASRLKVRESAAPWDLQRLFADAVVALPSQSMSDDQILDLFEKVVAEKRYGVNSAPASPRAAADVATSPPSTTAEDARIAPRQRPQEPTQAAAAAASALQRADEGLLLEPYAVTTRPADPQSAQKQQQEEEEDLVSAAEEGEDAMDGPVFEVDGKRFRSLDEYISYRREREREAIASAAAAASPADATEPSAQKELSVLSPLIKSYQSALRWAEDFEDSLAMEPPLVRVLGKLVRVRNRVASARLVVTPRLLLPL